MSEPSRASDDAITEVITATGHPNVSGTHESTFELTTDDALTPAGDCILGVGADRAPADFSAEFVAACRRQSAPITITLEAGGLSTTVRALGSPELQFENARSAVVRTSDYVDDRTVALAASHAAADVDRDLVAALTEGASLTATFQVPAPATD